MSRTHLADHDAGTTEDTELRDISSRDNGEMHFDRATKPPVKIWPNQPTLEIPPPRRDRSRSPDAMSLISADDFHELRRTASFHDADVSKQTDGLFARCKAGLNASWIRNKGLFLVLLAQVFGTLMNVTTRILEVEGNNGKGLHPFQILFARMGITLVISTAYMYHQRIPEFPFGAREVRPLLVARGMGGFFGVFGLYWSLQYLPLADATVITFLAPILACWVCSKVLSEPFTRTDKLAGCISLLGVLLIARPTSFFHTTPTSSPPDTPPALGADARALAHRLLHRATSAADIPTATPSQRLAAVAVALLGVCGAASAYTTIRWIGRRAHPLISVNYFAAWCTFVSTVALLALPRLGSPDVGFTLPATLREWGLLLFIGVTGFAMQFLLTAGLRYEKSSRATNMVYSQMLFALFFDKVVFGTTPNAWSVVGSGFILGAAVWVAVQKEAAKEKDGAARDEERGEEDGTEEEVGLVRGRGGEGADEELDDEDGGEMVRSGDRDEGGGDALPLMEMRTRTTG